MEVGDGQFMDRREGTYHGQLILWKKGNITERTKQESKTTVLLK